LDNGLDPIFEELIGIMLKIKSERNQVRKADKFLKRASDEYNRLVGGKIHLMSAMSECGK
jgi:hypothetical protein